MSRRGTRRAAPGSRLQAPGLVYLAPEPTNPGATSLEPIPSPALPAAPPRHRPAPNHKAPPRVFGPDGDPDSRAPGDLARRVSAILDEQAVPLEVHPVFRQADAERSREVARPAT